MERLMMMKAYFSLDSSINFLEKHRKRNYLKVPFIGNQAGGRFFLFLGTDDFWRDYNEMKSIGIEFVRDSKEQDYGTVAVFKDLYENLWDLVKFNKSHPMSKRIK